MVARRSRPGRGLRQPFPKTLANQYVRYIRRIEHRLLARMSTTVAPAMAAEERARGDSLTASVRRGLATLRRVLDEEWSDDKIERDVRALGRRLDDSHSQNFYTALNAAIGVEVVATEGFRGALINDWIADNVSLIKSVRADAIPGMARDIERAFAQGLRHEELIRRWRRDGIPLNFGTVRGRAKVIARDQVASLNGRLTETRQRAVGIDEYIWRTNIDGREREEHRDYHGHRYRWSSPPPDGHPGEAVQCRCHAEAVIDVDKILDSPNVAIVPATRGRNPRPSGLAPSLSL